MCPLFVHPAEVDVVLVLVLALVLVLVFVRVLVLVLVIVDVIAVAVVGRALCESQGKMRVVATPVFRVTSQNALRALEMGEVKEEMVREAPLVRVVLLMVMVFLLLILGVE
jgi:hypothetical protein